MDKIEAYINSVFSHTDYKSRDIQDMKQEMTAHLLQTVKELQESGLDEEESIRIALERFGGEFQIRKELSLVMKFQRIFAKKMLISSMSVLILSIVLFIISYLMFMGKDRIENIYFEQFQTLKEIMLRGGISGVDTYLNDISKEKDSENQLALVTIKEFPDRYQGSHPNQYPGDIKYIFPKNGKIDRGLKNSELLEINNKVYLIETLQKTDFDAKSNISGWIYAIALLLMGICWILLIVWSIVNAHRVGALNTPWCILFLLFSIVGYVIFLVGRNKFCKTRLFKQTENDLKEMEFKEEEWVRKYLAKKVFIFSVAVVCISICLYATSYALSRVSNYEDEYYSAQAKMIKNVFMKEGIAGLDDYMKPLLQNKSYQIVHIAVYNIPMEFKEDWDADLEKEKILYEYPKNYIAEKTNYLWLGGSEVVENKNYYFQIERKLPFYYGYDGTVYTAGVLITIFCWILLTVWSILKTYREKGFNALWCFVLILTGIAGYLLFILVQYIFRNLNSHN